jgi:hypothetical protein
MDRGERELMESLFAINRAISMMMRFGADDEIETLSESRDRIWKLGSSLFGWRD